MKIARPPRTEDLEDWKQWAEEVERIINLLLARQVTTTYTFTNVTTDRTVDANATSVDELADALGTLLSDLQSKGIIA